MARQASYPIRWLKAAQDSGLRKRELLVCAALCVHMDSKGICWPAYETIGARSGYGRNAVSRALNLLEELGWIIRSSHYRGRSNRYAGLIPDGELRPPRRDGLRPPRRGREEVQEDKEQEQDDLDIPF